MSNNNLYNHEVRTIRGETQTLDAYKGDVLLIVNTASKCGYAPQFTGLQKLYDTYRDQGFNVLGFPSAQFMNQELEEETAIAEFCSINHGVTFPMFAKVDVNGPTAHPLFQQLSKEAPGLLGSKSIKWNFTKFLVDRDGNVVKRFAPADKPEELEAPLRELLKNSAPVE
ncbi:glutathione peroxidase [Paenibacillus filicis]|uniref:Glutathione peroxidase n=1 Tax=Paenibacillus filicis TaxID=669464 RepID=A0ABU9DJX8_9BACL